MGSRGAIRLYRAQWSLKVRNETGKRLSENSEKRINSAITKNKELVRKDIARRKGIQPSEVTEKQIQRTVQNAARRAGYTEKYVSAKQYKYAKKNVARSKKEQSKEKAQKKIDTYERQFKSTRRASGKVAMPKGRKRLTKRQREAKRANK